MKQILTWIFLLFIAAGCAIKPGNFTSTSVPAPPDYNETNSWAALPGKDDFADMTPGPAYPDLQSTATVDVFFIHPTTFTGKSKSWNASMDDARLNKKTDESTIQYQASIFNGAGRIYAPRYRQAHLRSFFSEDKTSSGEALNLAYSDIRKSFEYYLKHFNQGRPIIIATHSQGTVHGLRLLKQFFEGTMLQEKLVAAYLIGWPVPVDSFNGIPPCKTPEQTACICSWRTWLHGNLPTKKDPGGKILVTNPLNWVTDDTYAPASLNEGAVLRKFDEVLPGIADAQVNESVLWVHKPKFPGSFLIRRKNYHVADLNLFYINVRTNAQLRAKPF